MRSFLASLPLLLGTTLPALASDCPAATDHSVELDGIIAEIQSAPDEMTARRLSNGLWELWTDAPDAQAQDLLGRGMALREQYAFLESREVLTDLIEYCPDYAEGYNQRAFSSFLRRDFDSALWDLDRALEINPRHVAALSGRALTLMGLGRDEEAQATLRAALELNPWLSERSLLKEPPGQDI
ncbi:tetratricopeptide repeat protein [Roseisalinus antarcticus]|uniref:Tetratricopeptide repeat protein n=1 Tax=Roseisalinus antarcticus TaxID=254357 RepID=A0A1Y5RYB8_9RHOB|nr:tetratricopeptide repeat protein [Roseisalinus antarcticus]SLN28417.1 Tetratricopeptide repeat protein [Roseisalinus antarcticus]